MTRELKGDKIQCEGDGKRETPKSPAFFFFSPSFQLNFLGIRWTRSSNAVCPLMFAAIKLLDHVLLIPWIADDRSPEDEGFLHDDLRLGNVAGDRLVWQDRTSIDIDLVLDGHIVAQY